MNVMKFILGVLITTTLFSCGGDKKKPIYVETEIVTEEMMIHLTLKAETRLLSHSETKMGLNMYK